jgi:uncharacterized membrane protein
MHNKSRKSLKLAAIAAGLGVVAGLRSFAAPAVLSWGANERWIRLRDKPGRLLERRRTRQVISTLAVAELIGDKTPFVPNRTQFPSLAWRIASGALVGAAVLSSNRRSALLGLAAGGLGALAGTYGGFYVRRNLSARIPDRFVAVAEDAIAVGSGVLLLKAA